MKIDPKCALPAVLCLGAITAFVCPARAQSSTLDLQNQDANGPAKPAGDVSRLEGERVARIALVLIGRVPVKTLNGTPADLRTGVDNPSFVSQVFALADVPCPVPPASDMGLFGRIVDWKEGPVRMAGLVVNLPAPDSGPGLQRDGLRPGDRVIFQANPDDPTQSGTDQTGIYVGKYGDMERAVVMANAARGGVVVVNLDEPMLAGQYRYAVRGWMARQIYVPRNPSKPNDPTPTRLLSGADLIRGRMGAAGSTVPSSVQGRVFAVCIGVDRYAGGAKGADAAQSARRVFEALQARVGKEIWSKTSVLLTDEAPNFNPIPTREEIAGAIEQAARQAGPNDTLLVYLAGQGKGSDFLPSGANREAAPARRVSLNDTLRRALTGNAGRLVLLLDYNPVELPRPALDEWRAVQKEMVAIAASGALPASAPGYAPGRFADALVRSLSGDGVMQSTRAVFDAAAKMVASNGSDQDCQLYASEDASPLLGKNVAVSLAARAANPTGSKSLVIPVDRQGERR